jgi:hypothetical protein
VDGLEILLICVAIGAKFAQTNYRYEFLLQKYSISKKKHLYQIFGSEDIVDLKSSIF